LRSTARTNQSPLIYTLSFVGTKRIPAPPVSLYLRRVPAEAALDPSSFPFPNFQSISVIIPKLVPRGTTDWGLLGFSHLATGGVCVVNTPFIDIAIYYAFQATFTTIFKERCSFWSYSI
jgi:hypothetical protein